MSNSPSTPTRPTRFISYSPSSSPLSRKKQRLNAANTASMPATPARLSAPPLPHSPYRFNANNEVVDNPAPSAPSLPSVVAPATSDGAPTPPITHATGLERSLAELEAESHAIREAFTAEEQSDKATGPTYARHVKNYEHWWNTSQGHRQNDDPSHTIVPAFPITAAKVTVFLEYEMTRPQKRKREDGTDSTATVGSSHVKQVISALENRRLSTQHNYLDNPAAQIGLGQDYRIQKLESAAEHKEPACVKMAHTLKAKGTNADTFTSADVIKCSDWCLTDFKGPTNIWIGLRDRGMLLTSCSVAFRGDSTRNLLLSDLFMTDVIMNAKGLGETISALTMIADNAKHNQQGRTDEHGALRHRHVELCPVGAIALLLFSYFHVKKSAVPNFAPDFSDSQYGDYGKREWYGMYLFPSGKDPMSEMSYDNHRKRVNLIFERNDVNISKVTHAGREFSVKTAREYGATVDGAKALGGWSDSGSFKPCYDRALPMDALLGAAMFDAAKPESHFLPREFLEPPAELMEQIFPWVEAELAALEAREREDPFARDIALHQFFKLLIWFRILILQDGALLYTKYPQSPLFSYSPFNSDTFREFATASVDRISDVETRGRLAVKNLPQNLVRGFQGAVSSLTMAQRAARDETRAQIRSLEAQIQALAQRINDVGQPQRRSRDKREPVLIPPPFLSSSSSFLPSAPAVVHISNETSLRLGLEASIDDGMYIPPAESPFQSCPFPTSTQQGLDVFGPYPAQEHDVHHSPGSTSLSIPTSSVISPSSLIPSTSQPPSSVARTAAWNLLALKYTDARLRRHDWDWIEATNSFLPKYDFQPVKKITDIWTEWATGLNGFLSIRELEEGWNAKWKRDSRKIKSEWSRRSKVIKLIESLQQKQNWNLELALRFIRETYETDHQFNTVRKFCDYIQSAKIGGLNAVFTKSCTFVN